MNYKTISILLILGVFISIIVFSFFEHEQMSDLEGQLNMEKTALDIQAANQDNIDEPDGFEVEVLAPHAPFPDHLAAKFSLIYAEQGGEEIVNDMRDASTMIVAEVNWEELGSTSGWHYHPGIALVTIVEGELEVTMKDDCIPRNYEAGEAWLDPGDIHKAIAATDGVKAMVTFLGIPDGEPATVWVEPVEC